MSAECNVRIPLQEHSLNTPLVKETSAPAKIDTSKSPQKPLTKVFQKESPKEEHDVLYFRNLLKENTENLKNLSIEWESYKVAEDVTESSEQILGDIRTTVGQAHLIMKERFTQFEGLVNHSEFGTSEKPVTCQDLQGFWDMIYFQVEDVLQKFDKLKKRRDQNWRDLESQPVIVPVPKKRKLVRKKSAVSQAAQERREQARKRLAAAKAALKKDADFPLSFDAGFFKVNSPVRAVIERTKTPCSKEKRKPATPSSANFMHGRFLKVSSGDATVTLKKTLDFEETPEPESSSEQAKGCDTEKEIVQAKQQGALPSPTPSPVALHKATETETWHQLTAKTALEVIQQQLETLRGAFRAEQKNKRLETTEQQTDAQENLKQTPTSLADDSYEAHYRRLHAKVRSLEVQLGAFEKLRGAIVRSREKGESAFRQLQGKAEEMDELRKRLLEREATVMERESRDNQELKSLKTLRLEHESEIAMLREKTADCQILSDKVESLTKMGEEQSKELAELHDACSAIKRDRDTFRDSLEEQSRLRTALEENLSKISEERDFEQTEFANDKKFLEEILAKTETELDLTKDHMSRLQTTSDQRQAEVNSLNGELEQARSESFNLQKELDITKTSARFQILELQQEVVNCEIRLRDVVARMNDFNARLQLLGPDDKEETANPIEAALKTPSKSLVVSALLAECSSSNTSSPYLPENQQTSTESLFSRIADADEVLASIVKVAKEVAVSYEDRLAESRVVNSCLRETIESLRADAKSKEESQRKVDALLRRRLDELQQKNELLESELKNKRKKRPLLSE